MGEQKRGSKIKEGERGDEKKRTFVQEFQIVVQSLAIGMHWIKAQLHGLANRI